MSELKAELLEELSEKQSYYKLNRPIKIGFSVCGAPKRIKDIIKGSRQFKPEWEVVSAPEDGVSVICMSDAHTHAERLIFPCLQIRNKDTGEIKWTHVCSSIAGEMTFMSYGGCRESMLPIEDYVKQLERVNKTKEAQGK